MSILVILVASPLVGLLLGGMFKALLRGDVYMNDLVPGFQVVALLLIALALC